MAPLSFKCLNCGESTKKRSEKASQATGSSFVPLERKFQFSRSAGLRNGWEKWMGEVRRGKGVGIP